MICVTIKLRLKAKGYGIYKTDTVLAAQALEIERLFSQIIKSVVKELVDEQQRSEENGTNRKKEK